MPSGAVDTVIFDLGGVLIDWDPRYLYRQLFVKDEPGMERFLADSALPAERLELRIPVTACFARGPSDFDSLAKRGVQFVVDDLGRGMDWPLDWLSRAPIHGLQLNRGWVKTMHSDPNTLNLCRAGTAIAKTFALTPIAAGDLQFHAGADNGA